MLTAERPVRARLPCWCPVTKVLLELIRAGDAAGALALLREDREAARKAAAAVRPLRERMLAAPIGQRDPAWHGKLSEGHVDAAQLAHLAALPAARAASVGGLSRHVADALPQLVPDDLPVVET